MKYRFSVFILDPEKKLLKAGGKTVPLTKQHYQLLLLLIQNKGDLVSKDTLIKHIWKDRSVENNSINRSLSKLRKVLNSVKKQDYFQSIYGQGVKFLPKVKTSRAYFDTTKAIILLLLLSTIFATFTYLHQNNSTEKTRATHKNSNKNTTAGVLLVLPTANKQATDKDEWLKLGSNLYLQQLLGYSAIISLKDYQNKPENLNQQEYLQNQWKLTPSLQTVSTEITKNNSTYTVVFKLTNSQQKVNTQTFSNANLSYAYKQAGQWLSEQLNLTKKQLTIASLIPQDSYLTELYLRGLAKYSHGEFNKAMHFFQLCLDEDPGFHIARLQLAKAKYRAGKQLESLVLLDALSLIDVFPVLQIEIGALRGNILEKQGKHIQARDIYLNLIEKFSKSHINSLNDVRYNLSYTYTTLTEYSLALQQLQIIESTVSVSKANDILPDVLQKKGSLYQKLGKIKLAEKNATQALSLFNDMGDTLGSAKVLALLGRIAAHQADYKTAESHFLQTLALAQSLDYQLGIGATLNELIYTALAQGQIVKADKLNKQMKQIAIDIDYKALLLASIKWQVDMMRRQKKWQMAQLYLEEHKQLATELSSQRSLINNKILNLEVLLDQNLIANVPEIIDQLQKHIKQSNEIRLQPRLDKQLARYYLLNKQTESGLNLLSSAKQKALKTEDGETIIEINNILASYYLKSNEAQLALGVLAESLPYKPVDYPYLLLKAKAFASLNQAKKAMELTKKTKLSTPDLWSIEDEKFLSSMTSI